MYSFGQILPINCTKYDNLFETKGNLIKDLIYGRERMIAKRTISLGLKIRSFWLSYNSNNLTEYKWLNGQHLHILCY